MNLPDFSNLKIAIVGDAMKDVYVHGRLDRISPEAPVPVFVEESRETRQGGAANVAANVDALGANATLICKHESDWPIKTRYMVGGRQVFRADLEETTEAQLERLQFVSTTNLIIISDYAKGAVSREAMNGIRHLGIPFIVDPKGRDWRLYVGAKCITPNEKEYASVRDDYIAMHDRIVVTRGAAGCEVLQGIDGSAAIPARPVQAIDVTGAGDTFIAALGCCLACGMELVEAARIANVAASIVVAKPGTATCSRAELEAAL